MKKSLITNILFCGIGGQGVLSASEVCGWAALYQGYHVKKSEVHGMAQRGGSVESHLRFGKKVFSPLVPFAQADYLVSFYKDEGVRLKGFLKKKGTDLSEYLACSHKCLEDKKYLNTYLVGVLSRHLSIGEECWVKALEMVFKGKNIEENKKVFFQGRGKRL
jgi:indolepyruvate ferredoxin oxidoreductase beta subunit